MSSFLDLVCPRRKIPKNLEFIEFQLLSVQNIDSPPTPFSLEYNESNVTTNNDFYTDNNAEKPPPWRISPFFGIMLFGRTSEGISLALRVQYKPTLLVQLPEIFFQPKQLDALWNYIFKTKRTIRQNDFSAKLVYFKKTGGFFPDTASKEPRLAQFPFWEVTCSSTLGLSQLRKFLTEETHSVDDLKDHSFPTVEKEIPPILKLLYARGGKCSGIFRVPQNSLEPCTYQRTTHCDAEFVLSNVQSLEALPQRDEIFPVVILSFDIEVVTPNPKIFPKASNPQDRVICIASTLINTGTGQIAQMTHTLGPHSPVEGVGHCCYDKEPDLIEAWRDFVIATDPDVIIGYNTSFDWSYLATRMELFNENSRFFFLSRLVAHRSKLQNKQFSSKAHGTSDSSRLDIPGRIDFDVYVYVSRNYKLKDYKLNSVSKHFLKDQEKADLSIPDMMDAYNSRDPDRVKLVVQYCVQDTLLPYLIWKDQLFLESLVEMSRVCFVFIQDLLDRGQMFKIICQMYVHARDMGFCITGMDETSKHTGGFQGATVLACKSGFYENIMVLDFMSLYPSIMQAHNLCFSSLVTREEYNNLPQFQYESMKTDLGTFAFQTTIPGLLPQIIGALLAERKTAKKAMAQNKGTKLETIFNARQLALKISCNSIYGFTGAQQSNYYCPQIASSVTAYGRQLIETTQNTIEKLFDDCEVIYGDTDSVMVRFGTTTDKNLLFDLAHQAAQVVANVIGNDIKLEVEKLYSPGIFFDKKRYAGLCFESANQAQPKLEAKGIILVRRDFCAYQQKTFKQVLHTVLYERDIPKSLEVLKASLKELTTGKVPFEDLVLSKKLAPSYKNPNILQKVVADKIDKRMPGSGPKPGDRVDYVVIKTPQSSKNPLFERVESAAYAKLHSVPLDYAYYVQTFKPCLTQLFSVMKNQTPQVIDAIFDSFISGTYSGFSQSSMSEFCSSTSILTKRKEQSQVAPLPPPKIKKTESKMVTTKDFFKPSKIV